MRVVSIALHSMAVPVTPGMSWSRYAALRRLSPIALLPSASTMPNGPRNSSAQARLDSKALRYHARQWSNRPFRRRRRCGPYPTELQLPRPGPAVGRRAKGDARGRFRFNQDSGLSHYMSGKVGILIIDTYLN